MRPSRFALLPLLAPLLLGSVSEARLNARLQSEVEATHLEHGGALTEERHADRSPAAGKSVSCTRYVIVHDAHEGSHGLEGAMSQAHGTFSMAEIADGRETGPLTKVAMAAFAQGDQPLLARLVERAYRNLTMTRPQDAREIFAPLLGIKDVDCAAGQIIGALARDDQPEMFAHHDVAIFVLVRTDLMRWALSLSKSITKGCMHPQFGGCTDKGKHRVDLLELKQTALELVSHWKLKGWFAKRTARGDHLGSGATLDCSRVYFVSYEAFLDSNGAVVDAMFSHLQRFSPLARSLPTPRPNVFKKVHSEKISGWIENYQEVYNMFMVERFPTFADILHESGFAQLCPQQAKPSARS
ncbi:hypothetical protein T492DRAFT_910572 [Pavlovales sp. CCMP2436]|nr:hypothetical protein T492DRAFT_910572 [Pavlovales sp. CCMP2436]